MERIREIFENLRIRFSIEVEETGRFDSNVFLRIRR